MKNIVIAIIAMLVMAFQVNAQTPAPAAVPPSYSELDTQLRTRLADALKANKGVAEATLAIEALAKARYLNSASEVTELITAVTNQFRPQAESAGPLIKQALGAILKETSNDNPQGVHPVIAQAFIAWFNTTNVTAAKEAVGDITAALPIQPRASELYYKELNGPAGMSTIEDYDTRSEKAKAKVRELKLEHVQH